MRQNEYVEQFHARFKQGDSPSTTNPYVESIHSKLTSQPVKARSPVWLRNEYVEVIDAKLSSKSQIDSCCWEGESAEQWEGQERVCGEASCQAVQYDYVEETHQKLSKDQDNKSMDVKQVCTLKYCSLVWEWEYLNMYMCTFVSWVLYRQTVMLCTCFH